VARRQGRRARAARGRLSPATATVLALMASALAAPAFGAGNGVAAPPPVAIQDGGRLKPLDTFARETARRVAGARPFTGGETVKGRDALDWLLDGLSSTERWQREPILGVAAAGLPAARDRYSFAELVAHDGLAAALRAVQEKRDRGEAPTPVDDEVARLGETLGLVRDVFSGEALRIVPVAEASGTWRSVAGLDDADAPVRDPLAALVDAPARGDRAGVGRPAA